MLIIRRKCLRSYSDQSNIIKGYTQTASWAKYFPWMLHSKPVTNTSRPCISSVEENDLNMLLSTAKLQTKSYWRIGLLIHEVCLTFLYCALFITIKACTKMTQSKHEILSGRLKFNSDTYRGHQYQAHGSCISHPLLYLPRHYSQASLGTDIVVKSSHFLCNSRKTSRLVRTLLQTVSISRPWQHLGSQAACIPLQPLFYPKTKIHQYVPRLHKKIFQHVQRMSRWNQLNGCEHLLKFNVGFSVDEQKITAQFHLLKFRVSQNNLCLVY